MSQRNVLDGVEPAVYLFKVTIFSSVHTRLAHASQTRLHHVYVGTTAPGREAEDNYNSEIVRRVMVAAPPPPNCTDCSSV